MTETKPCGCEGPCDQTQPDCEPVEATGRVLWLHLREGENVAESFRGDVVLVRDLQGTGEPAVFLSQWFSELANNAERARLTADSLDRMIRTFQETRVPVEDHNLAQWRKLLQEIVALLQEAEA